MTKSTIFTTIAVLIALTSVASAADEALAFGTTTTEGKYLSVEMGVHSWINDNFQIMALCGMYRSGIVMNHQGSTDWYTSPKRDVSLQLRCWVI